MKLKTKVIALVTSLGVLGLAGTAYAAEFRTPAEIAASLTGKTVEQVTTERSTGKTYGTIANEVGKLEQFKQGMLEQKKAILDQRVNDGSLTQEDANAIYNAIETNQATCDGTGNAQIGRQRGAGFGKGMMQGQGRGQSFGRGMGTGGCVRY